MEKDYKKLYEEALERAKYWAEGKCVEDFDDSPQNVLNFVFHEAKESEDEKIRKELIEFVKSRGGFKQEYIAWLEEQGEQKPDFCHHEVDFSKCSEEYRKAYYDGWNNCNQQHEQMKNLQKPTWSEEDEKIFDSIIEDVMPYGECPDCPTDEEREYFYEGNRKVDWLKSLKERLQPKQELSVGKLYENYLRDDKLWEK